jgi:hypothetical protein
MRTSGMPLTLARAPAYDAGLRALTTTTGQDARHEATGVEYSKKLGEQSNYPTFIVTPRGEAFRKKCIVSRPAGL